MIQGIVTILAILAAAMSFTVGSIVVRGDRSNPYRRSFVILSALVSLWIVSNVAFYFGDGTHRYVIALISYVAAMLMVVQALIFCLQFVNKNITDKKMALLSSLGIVAAVLSAIPGFIAYGVRDQTILTHTLPLVVYACIIFGYIVAACWLLLSARKKTTRKNRKMIDSILLGLSISAIAGAFCNMLLPLLGIYVLVQLGPACAVVFIASIAYAIVKHGLFDVRLAVVRSATYSLVLLTMVGLYVTLVWVLSTVLKASFVGINPVESIVNVGIALVLAIIFQPIKRFFDRLTSSIFYRDNYNTEDFYGRISQEISITTDLRSLLRRASDEIVKTFSAEHAFFFIRYGENRYMNAGTSRHGRLFQEEIEIIDAYVAIEGDKPLITELLVEKSSLRKLLSKHKIAVVLPLTRAKENIGYLFLSERRSRDYTVRDIRTLETVSDELVIAIQNALAVQEIKELNATLQDRIDEATKELRTSNRTLQKLDETKDEFVSMASHQLRTPLTSVKGYISMVLEGDAGKISPMQKQLLTEAFTSSERMVHLISDFLNVSRLQTGKFMVDRHPIDLAKMVAQEVDSLQTTAKAHELKLQYKMPPYFPILHLDEGKMRQVVMNFIDNAIYYSREHTTITVSLRIEDGDAVFRVKDTGIGVPEAEQAGLFTKFFRATNARRQRPDGTGVGLFLARKIIVAHEGDIIFESIEGEGSTFGFRLPIKKLSLAPVDDADQLK